MRLDARLSLPLIALALSSARCGAPPSEEVVELGEVTGAAGQAPTKAVDISVWSRTIADSQVSCMWDAGVRHVVVGTQNLDIAREQLDQAVAGGMTVNLYVYLYWDESVRAQVNEALQLARGRPVGRIWLDVEEDPGSRGRDAMIALVREGFDACGAFPCGIYTGRWWWRPNIADTTVFADKPLWYASYDARPTMGTWPSDKFGGWVTPAAKQYAGSTSLCGMTLDLNVMLVNAEPTVVVNRTVPADDGRAPPAPVGLYPSHRLRTDLDYAKVMAAAIPRATRWQFEIESWTGTTWRPYVTWSESTNYRVFSPAIPATTYRFRARAQNTHGWGAWSVWSTFDFGAVRNPPPDETTPPPTNPPPTNPPPTNPPPTNPPPSTDPNVPSGLAPANDAHVTGSSVTLSASAVAGAASYQFELDYEVGGQFTRYYTYTGSAPSRTFWPQAHGTRYRFRVRAQKAGTWGGWSEPATFRYD